MKKPILLFILLLGQLNVHASELSQWVSSQNVDTLTRSKENENLVHLLHLGKNSRPARLKLIQEAKRYIFIKMPYWYNDETGREQLNALVEAKRRNPQLIVKITYDWLTPAQSDQLFKKPIFDDLKKEFGSENLSSWNPIQWRRPFSFSILRNRLHDKLLVVDGEKMIVGGMNFADHYLRGGEVRDSWHDTDVLIEGPLATDAAELFAIHFELSKAFSGSLQFPPNLLSRAKLLQDVYWNKNQTVRFSIIDKPQAGPKKWRTTHSVYIPFRDKYPKEIFYPYKLQNDINTMEFDTTKARLVYDDTLVDVSLNNGKPQSKIAIFSRELIRRAKQEVRMIIPYMTLTKTMRNELSAAARRGVRVQLITNSLESHDLGQFPYMASVKDMLKLTQAGVKIFVWRGHSPLIKIENENKCEIKDDWTGHTIHTKGVSVDGEVLIIGSHNFNVRSEKHNNEIAVVLNDTRLANEFNEIFEYDLDREHKNKFVTCGRKSYPKPRNVIELSEDELRELYQDNKLKVDILSKFKFIM